MMENMENSTILPDSAEQLVNFFEVLVQLDNRAWEIAEHLALQGERIARVGVASSYVGSRELIRDGFFEIRMESCQTGLFLRLLRLPQEGLILPWEEIPWDSMGKENVYPR